MSGGRVPAWARYIVQLLGADQTAPTHELACKVVALPEHRMVGYLDDMLLTTPPSSRLYAVASQLRTLLLVERESAA